MIITAGIDLGKLRDYVGVAVNEKHWQPHPTKRGVEVSAYQLRHLERYKDVAYPDVVKRTSDLMAKLREVYHGHRVFLAVDCTGVGVAVMDMFLAASLPCQLVPITFTGGDSVTPDGRGGYRVPKKELVTTAQVLLPMGRLKIAKNLKLTPVLVDELTNFRVKQQASGHEKLEAWREGDHDDVLFAECMALWVGENTPDDSEPVDSSDADSEVVETSLYIDEALDSLGFDRRDDGTWDLDSKPEW